MEIKANLFNLSPDDIKSSEMMYNGKIIKCLVAPYHTYEELEKIIPYTKTTYLFPEREVPAHKLRSLVDIAVNSAVTDEIRFVTTNMSVICDMVDPCVRVLTEDGRILPSPCKTFASNIHTIRYELLENKSHQVSEDVKTKAHKSINNLMDELRGLKEKGKSITKAEYDVYAEKIDMIGEPRIKNPMMNMLDVLPISSFGNNNATVDDLLKQVQEAITAGDTSKASSLLSKVESMKKTR
jgi:hypothetical protein